MRIAEIMTKQVETVSPEVPGFLAWERMRQKGIRHLVVMKRGEVIGILSNRDAGGRCGSNERAKLRVHDMMTPRVATVAPDVTIRKAANLMRGRTIGCLPVVERGKLIGIVTTSDLLDILGRGRDRPIRSGRRPLHHRVAHRKSHGAFGVW